jgi:hypothetical protein
LYAGCFNPRSNRGSAQQPFLGRNNFGGNNFGRSGGRFNNHDFSNPTASWKPSGGERSQAARSSEPTNFGSEVNQRHTCHLCGSPYHWADVYEIKRLRDQIREMKITTSGANDTTWCRPAQAHLVEVQDDPAENTALNEVLEVCVVEIQQH